MKKIIKRFNEEQRLLKEQEKDLLCIYLNRDFLELKLSLIEREMYLFARHFSREQKERIRGYLEEKSELEETKEAFKLLRERKRK
ncbi:hypothetical protein F2N09_08600 [Campylobacter upsaliensis]|uniref:hypothetical protein n=1 Tax=Campylobacter upsaliensis TaxID=28080 RepID=UPI001361F150|nr:hypothetical protein [Campylobacter upsaliensis]ECV9719197.1 hypothetical protein [Campylobacter upsaliensis]EDP6897484.1 hypothetical protein [Campylobacter upsaliensis]MBT0803560.1 hypothetical protein [Campylobacter upsaliensis]